METAAALLLGFFVPGFALGERVGLPAGFAGMALYFCACQFFLSRGHREALRQDRRTMAALVTVPVLAILVMCLVERLDVILSQGAGILLSSVGGTLAGALVASRRAGTDTSPRPSR
ncbi:MAG: hypothetical protein U0167_06550 [bacterium]